MKNRHSIEWRTSECKQNVRTTSIRRDVARLTAKLQMNGIRVAHAKPSWRSSPSVIHRAQEWPQHFGPITTLVLTSYLLLLHFGWKTMHLPIDFQ